MPASSSSTPSNAAAPPSNPELLDGPEPRLNPFLIESLLSIKTDPVPKTQGIKRQADRGKPVTTAVPASQVLGKVKDFLGVMAKANEKLELDAKGSSRAKYDVEVLSGNEDEYIEMDLLLGVTDLHTDEAVAAAEATISSFQPSIPFSGDSSSSSSSSGSSSTEDSGDDYDDDDDGSRCIGGGNGITKCHEDKFEKPNMDDSLSDDDKSNKRPKIVELN